MGYFEKNVQVFPDSEGRVLSDEFVSAGVTVGVFSECGEVARKSFDVWQKGAKGFFCVFYVLKVVFEAKDLER